MLKSKLTRISSIFLILYLFSIPVYAKGNNETNQANQQTIIQPYFTNISLFQNGFDISSSGKATVSVYLTAQNVDSVKVDAYLQQYKNGTWTTIKSWTSTTDGTYSGLGESYYVVSGYSY